MIWHARWGRSNPQAKPAKIGDVFGIFEVIDTAPLPDPHYGIRAKVRCSRCGCERVSILAQLRHKPPVSHRGCKSEPMSDSKRETPPEIAGDKS